MRSGEIQKLIDAVEAAYGPVRLYGSDPSEEHGTCFYIPGAAATLSVHTHDGELPPGRYDIQIEGQPPGDYVYTDVVSLDEILKLIVQVRGPEERWPGIAHEV